MFFLLARGSASARPSMQRRRNLEKSAVPTLLVPGSRPGFHATMCRAAGDLGACWNKILTIFDPYTFSRSQGHERSYRWVHADFRFTPDFGRSRTGSTTSVHCQFLTHAAQHDAPTDRR